MYVVQAWPLAGLLNFNLGVLDSGIGQFTLPKNLNSRLPSSHPLSKTGS